MKETCKECSEKFLTYMDLRNHVLEFHPKRLNELAPLPRYQKNLVCDKCFARFRSIEGLKRHVRKLHSLNSGESDDGKIANVLKRNVTPKETLCCPECNFTTKYSYTFKRHIREKHEDLVETLVPNSRSSKLEKKCPLCSYSDPSKDKINNHFTNDHHIKLQTKIFNFTSMPQFYEWKNTMEKDTTCRYVQNSKAVTENGKRATYRYICHRSGYYRNHGRGTRQAKYKGTNKINSYCPSELLVISEKNICEVHYVKTHIGHSNEIQRITLTPEERDYLALKIANKIPFDKILEEVRIAKNNEMIVDRMQLLTRKDLYNIAKRYSLKESAVLWDDKDVDTWARDTEGVVFYKAQGTECKEHAFLTTQDFVMIIMNVSQKEIFDQYHRDLICISSLAGANDHFDLTTLMVRDEALYGFPCAFMFSSRTDERMMEFFFTCLTEKVGKLRVKALMTDLTDIHYNAWIKVMDPPQRRLYCSWNIDKAWRARLNKIKSAEERRSVYTSMKNLQTESIEHKYKKMLHDFVNDDSVDIEFRRYFADLFVPCDKLWACCYRIDDGINEDSQLLQIHDHLKYICTYGKKQKPLTQILNAVMQMVGNNLVSRRVILNSNETVYHLNLIQKRHRDSYLGSFDSIITVTEGWHVPSFSELNEPYELYFVHQVVKKCNCNYTCTECHICIHQFACSCIDHSVEGNMCKHIHLAIRYRDGKKHFILDEGSGKFKDINSEDEDEKSPENCETHDTTEQRVLPITSTPRFPNFIAKRSKKTKIADRTVNTTSKVQLVTNTSESSDRNSSGDIEMNYSSDNEFEGEERIIIDDLIDTNTIELSVISNNTVDSTIQPTSTTLRNDNSRRTVSASKEFLVPDMDLENKRSELIKQFNDQINKIKSMDQMLSLENILSQIDKKIIEFEKKST